MRKSKFTDSQIMVAVKRVEAGFGMPDICRDEEKLKAGIVSEALEKNGEAISS
jgi:hypothetical protein